MFGGKLLPELSKTVGQTQIKAEHPKGTRLILELLSVRAAAWEFSLSRLGKRVRCVQTAERDDGALVARGKDKRIQYQFVSSPISPYSPAVI